MTKEITKAFILQEMENKFKLREWEKETFKFAETVVPVYSIEQHIQHWEQDDITISITSATAFDLFEVPENERWSLRSYVSTFLTGAYTIAGIYIVRANTPTLFTYLDLTAAQSVSYLQNLPVLVTLDPRDKIKVNVDGYTTVGNFRLYIDVMKEEIR